MNDNYKANIARAMLGGINYTDASSSGRELENVSFGNPLYEYSMLNLYNRDDKQQYHSNTYYRFKGYGKLTDRQKCIEEIIRQTELLKEEAIGLKVINWIKIQNINTRFRYLSSVGLLF